MRRQCLDGAGIKQPPTRPGELVAEEGEVSEDWVRVGNARARAGVWMRVQGILKGDRMSSAGGEGGTGRHLPAPSSPSRGLSLSAALSAVALILRRNKNKAIIVGVPAS